MAGEFLDFLEILDFLDFLDILDILGMTRDDQDLYKKAPPEMARMALSYCGRRNFLV